MSKNRITLQDGTIDLSGDYIAYTDRLVSDDKPLPYAVKEVMEAPPPRGFIKFLEADFTDPKTAETLIYYLSLIPAMETDFRYGAVFCGGAGTGKTAVLEIMREVFQGYFVNIPPEVLSHHVPGEKMASPYISELENKGAGVVPELPDGSRINAGLWKTLTGGDTITARRPYHAPVTFVPTAQIILVTNCAFSFGWDDAIRDRLLTIPFTKKHERGNPETKTFSEIILELKPEFPGIVHLLADHYVHLKRKMGGKIRQSPECRLLKEQFFEKEPVSP